MVTTSIIDCIEACEKCAMECSITVGEIIGRDGMERCTELCLDCADVCKLTSTLCSRDSRFIDDILGVCIEICESCAKECERMKAKQCDRCAEACWRCAEECRRNF